MSSSVIFPVEEKAPVEMDEASSNNNQVQQFCTSNSTSCGIVTSSKNNCKLSAPQLVNQRWLVRIPLDVCTLWDSLEGNDNKPVGKISVGSDGQIGLSLSVVKKPVVIRKHDAIPSKAPATPEKKTVKNITSQGISATDGCNGQDQELDDLELLDKLYPPSPVPVPVVPEEDEEEPAATENSGDVFDKYVLSEYGTTLQNNMVSMRSIYKDNNNTKDSSSIICSDAVFGTVTKKLRAFPVRGKDYSEFIKKKNEADKRKRMPIKLKKPVVAQYLPVSNHAHNIEKEKKRKNDRRYRMDREELSSKLFEVFENKQRFSFKSLLEETQQPSTFLKDVLMEYCNFNSKGIHRSTWELKPEYRHYEDSNNNHE